MPITKYPGAGENKPRGETLSKKEQEARSAEKARSPKTGDGNQIVKKTESKPEEPKVKQEQATEVSDQVESSDNESYQPALRRQQDKHITERRSAEQKSTYQKKSPDQNTSQVPKQFGHKININPELAKANVAQLAEELEPPPFLNRETFQRILKDHPKIARQILEKPTQEMRQRFIMDGVLKKYPQAAQVQQKMAEQAQRQQQTQQRQVLKDVADEVLKKGDLAQLFRLRHQSEDKDALKNVLRHELAKAKARALQERVQGVKNQAEGQGGEGKAGSVSKSAQIADHVKQALAQKLSQASSASEFESILQKALAGSKVVPGLPDGIKARFLLKTDAQWQTFFQNVFQMSGAEVKSQAQLQKLAYALYRGMYQKADTGKLMLVADLMFGEAEEHKFAQLLLDQDIAEILKKLNPGDEISKELLKRLGEEISYLKLAHMVNQAQLTEEQKQAILKEFQKQFSSASRNQLENALIATRHKKEEEEKKNPPFVYAGHQFDNKEERTGPPKLFMALLYAVLGITAILMIFLLVRHLV